MFKAVFLDRDGVITQDPPHYAHRLDQFALLPGSGPAIKLLNENQFRVIVITNQSGVARGMYKETDITIFNNAMIDGLKQYGASVDAIYYCPHHPDAKIEDYRINCNCRKPKPGMLINGGNKFEIDFKISFLVGDKWSDVEAGRSVGCKTILVKTGHGVQELMYKNDPVDYIAADLLDAVQNYILITKR
jgi:D-glycero-D-manno-heptose 1,7-bisphosphate phosphatase